MGTTKWTCYVASSWYGRNGKLFVDDILLIIDRFCVPYIYSWLVTAMFVLCENGLSLLRNIIITSAELVLIGVEPGTLRFRVDVIAHYTTAPQLIDYMSPEEYYQGILL